MMNRPSLFARLIDPQARRGRWFTASVMAVGALVCELAARASTIRPNGQALSDYFQRGDAGPVLRLYDRLAGFGMSRGTVAALGFMPYLSARVFMWLARSLSPTLDARWSSDDGRVEHKWWTGGLTFVLALIQSYGMARFTQTIPGAVVEPAVFAETVIVQAAVAMFMMWLAEQVVDATEASGRFVGPGEEVPVVTSGHHNAALSPNVRASVSHGPAKRSMPID